MRPNRRPIDAPSAEDPAAPFEQVQQAARIVNGATKVLLYMGNGTRGTGSALVELAERLGAPVATTIQGKGVFPEQHPLWLWNGLGRVPSAARTAASRCDVMLAIGCRFAESAPGATDSRHRSPSYTSTSTRTSSAEASAALAVEADAAAFVNACRSMIAGDGARRPSKSRTDTASSVTRVGTRTTAIA